MWNKGEIPTTTAERVAMTSIAFGSTCAFQLHTYSPTDTVAELGAYLPVITALSRLALGLALRIRFSEIPNRGVILQVLVTMDVIIP